MTSEPLHVVFGGLTRDAPLDTAISRAILEQVDAGDRPATLQVGMPHDVVAFGKHDTLTGGFTAAVATAADHGFDTTIRIAGGRAVVFHSGTVRFAWTVPTDEPARDMHARFATLADAVVASLSNFGVPARVGELPAEYCAGSYSVHLVGGGKVMGVGQRLARHAAQVAGMIVVADSAKVNSVLVPVYRDLGLTMNPSTTGAVTDVRSIEPHAIARALATHLAPPSGIHETQIDADTHRRAATFRQDHAPAHLRERTERS